MLSVPSMISAADIRVARARLGIKQDEFATKFGVDQATISRWEKNGPPESGPLKVLVEKILAELEENL